MIDDPWFYAAALPAVFLMGLSKGGFAGISTLSMPLMALVLPPLEAAAIMLPILMAQDVVSVITYRRDFNKEIVLILLAGAVVGIGLGVVLAAHVSNALIEFIVGLIAAGFVVHTWLRRGRLGLDAARKKPALASGLFWGACAGFTSFIANAGRAAVPGLCPAATPGAADLCRHGNDVFRDHQPHQVLRFWPAGTGVPGPLVDFGGAAAPSIASTYVGIWLVRRVESDRFYAIVYALTLAVGVYLVWVGGKALLNF